MNDQELKKLVKTVQGPWFWDLANKYLYNLCRKHPLHKKPEVAASKIWLIGRAYAAAIERRKIKDEFPNFYIDQVAPLVCKSDIDKWPGALSPYRKINRKSIPHVVEVHKRVTDLFKTISDQNKRSLASKYLHFHRPNLFFIYDSIAKKGMQQLLAYTDKKSEASELEDTEYRKFANRCLGLQQYILETYGVLLSTRQIDRLLLIVGKNAKKNQQH